MKYYKVVPGQAKIIGNSVAIYHGKGPSAAVRITATIGGDKNPWINQVWTEFLESIPHSSALEGSDLGFTVGDVKEIEPDKVYHVNVQFFAL